MTYQKQENMVETFLSLHRFHLQNVMPHFFELGPSLALVPEVGQPHQWALDKQKRLIKEKAEATKDGWNLLDSRNWSGRPEWLYGPPECHVMVCYAKKNDHRK